MENGIEPDEVVRRGAIQCRRSGSVRRIVRLFDLNSMVLMK